MVAKKRMVAGMWIPVHGRPTTQKGTHVFLVGPNQWVDAHPDHDPFEGVGGAGLFIAGMVNEPSRGQINVKLYPGYLLVVRDIAVGCELVTNYGTLVEYTRYYTVSKDIDDEDFDKPRRRARK